MTLQAWLDDKVSQFNQPSFIVDDPVSVPRRFTVQQDIELAAFFTAIMSWGRRATIINKANELMALMDNEPFAFITHHKEKDRKRFLVFRHRTLQPDDVIFLLDVLQRYYSTHESLEYGFVRGMTSDHDDVYQGIAGFHDLLFDQPVVMDRTRKHISTPVRGSSCKRLNMFLRWMVRADGAGVDFGLWKKITPSQLIIPLDIHTGNTARKLGLLHRHINDWQAAKELTLALKRFDADDPVKYDFALFGAGISGKAVVRPREM